MRVIVTLRTKSTVAMSTLLIIAEAPSTCPYWVPHVRSRLFFRCPYIGSGNELFLPLIYFQYGLDFRSVTSRMFHRVFNFLANIVSPICRPFAPPPLFPSLSQFPSFYIICQQRDCFRAPSGSGIVRNSISHILLILYLNLRVLISAFGRLFSVNATF